MKRWHGLTALAAILILGGCDERPLTTAEYDPAANFDGLKTYRWMEDSRRVTADRQIAADEVSKRVVTAIDNALASKGFSVAGDGKADFLIGYHVGLNRRLDVRSMNAYYNYPPGWAWDHYRYGRELDPKDPELPTMVLEDYGSVVVDIAAPADGRLIWRGILYAYVPKGRDARIEQKWFDDRAQELMGKFPPAP
jgi:hypothetical protein